MRRPAALPMILYFVLPGAAACVAMFAPDPVAQERISAALRTLDDRDPVAISPVRLLIAVLPVAALVARLIARRSTWR